MKWVPIVHIYQPPFQNQEIVNKVINEAYLNIIDILKRNKKFKINLNISGSLTEKLIEGGYQKIVNAFKNLAEKGQIEFLASAMYHPILPLIPRKEIERQIELNYNINRRYFGSIYKPKGFFPPELAVDFKLASFLDKKGFSWLILDETSAKGKILQQPSRIDNLDILGFFRERKLTDALENPQKFFEIVEKRNKRNILVTAHDGEMWGHNWAKGHISIEKIIRSSDIETALISQIINKTSKEIKSINIRPSSWVNNIRRLKKEGPYPLWNDRKNQIQKKMWLLVRLVAKIITEIDPKDKGYEWARKNLDQGLSSCSFWWVSAEWWNPDFAMRGMTLLIRAVRSINRIDPEIRLKAENLFLGIQKILWQEHWLRRYK